MEQHQGTTLEWFAQHVRGLRMFTWQMARVAWEASTLKLFVTLPLPKEARFVAE